MFAQFKQSLFPFSILLILCSIRTSQSFAADLLNCSDNTTGNANFLSNREQLLTNLTKEAAKFDGFYVTSVHAGQSDQMFGLIMCYIDGNWTMCSKCLGSTTRDATNRCPDSMSVSLSNNFCFLRYSPVNFTSQFVRNQQGSCLPDSRSEYSTTKDQTVHTLLDSLRGKAIQSTSRFANGSMDDTGKGKPIYALVQCTRDLPASECSLCLQSAINSMSDCSRQGNAASCRVVYVGCYIRYFANKPCLLINYPDAQPPGPALISDDHSPTPQRSPYGAPTSPPPKQRRSFRWLTIAGVSVACVAVIILATYIFMRRKQNGGTSTSTIPLEDAQALSTVKCYSELTFKVFELDILRLATSNFSDENKLGQGGFGSVYKASLVDGQVIAVKRLSAFSRQGLAELKNEVNLLAKVKHRNLVQLVGCCIQEREKLLCYELLPNGSLDKFLFAINDSVRREILNWKTRYNIIQGISSGLHYLHEKSTVIIVHRDLKASNILLDLDMTPKISDFGLARLFEEDQTHLETSKLSGTLGYIAPELLLGSYSTKSDVYSFGVLLLEIVTGKRICSFANSEHASSLISYVHQHAVEGDIEGLKDPVLEDASTEEFTKCIHIGLLCVQEDPTKRPSMKAVDIMLSGYSTTLPALPESPLPLSMSSVLSGS